MLRVKWSGKPMFDCMMCCFAVGAGYSLSSSEDDVRSTTEYSSAAEDEQLVELQLLSGAPGGGPSSVSATASVVGGGSGLYNYDLELYDEDDDFDDDSEYQFSVHSADSSS